MSEITCHIFVYSLFGYIVFGSLVTTVLFCVLFFLF